MTPFNVEKFLKDQPVITRNGKNVEKLKELRYKNSNQIYLTAIVDSTPVIWDIAGNVITSTDAGLDLFMADEVVYHWAQTKDILDTDPGKPNKYTKVIIVQN